MRESHTITTFSNHWNKIIVMSNTGIIILDFTQLKSLNFILMRSNLKFNSINRNRVQLIAQNSNERMFLKITNHNFNNLRFFFFTILNALMKYEIKTNLFKSFNVRTVKTASAHFFHVFFNVFVNQICDHIACELL